ncbi:Toll-like receptor 13 [Acipenser ruthenus]|uniref:Toll-like receptor 13 n=1 Tax=Acipenser ruthenus TaxID=7906 RepID=A0A444V2Z5_ACIRT|nr:Toll-like receptor 13 [Acipenser ruthenus]
MGAPTGSVSGINFLFLASLVYGLVLIFPTSGFSLMNCTVHSSPNATNLKVRCFNKRFYHVPTDKPAKTRLLDIAGNLISRLQRGDFTNLTYMRELNISHNHIHHIDEGTFRDLAALKELNLAENNLSVLYGRLFEGLKNLTVLQLGGNRIQEIHQSTFQPLVNVKVVNLSFNALHQPQRVQPVFRASRLERLYVGGNQFPSFNTENFAKAPIHLKALDMSYNPFTHFNITSDIFLGLMVLNLSYSGSQNGLHWELRNNTFVKGVKELNLNGFHMTIQGILSVIKNFAKLSLEELQLNNLNFSQAVHFLKDICLSLPKLKRLSLQGNSISTIEDSTFVNCSSPNRLDLSRNSLKNLSDMSFRAMPQLHFLVLSYNQLSTVPNATQNLTSLETLDLSYNLIEKLHSYDFKGLRRLSCLNLRGNYIIILNKQLFTDLVSLQDLKLHNNLILDIPEPLAASLRNLKTLNLGVNKLSTIKNATFLNLNSLRILYMSTNQISIIEEGAFNGLTKLRTLHLGNNKLTKNTFRGKNVFTGMPALKILMLYSNHINYETSDELEQPPFVALKSLTHLSFNSQGPKGLLHVPSNFLKGLPFLRLLYAGSLSLTSLDPDTFSYTPLLTYIDLNSNPLAFIDPRIFQNIPALEILYLDKMRLQSLDFLINANLTKVKFLSAMENEFTTLNKSHIQSLPSLKLLKLSLNPFTCGCVNAWFQNWSLQDTNTQVLNLYELSCGYPPTLRNSRLADFKFDSCALDLEFIFFVSTSTLVTLTMVSSFIFHFLRWQVVYAYHLFQAFLYDRKQKPSRRYEFDAFVSYNTHDEPWVLRELLPNLEQGRGWKLCLHHRDFQPGKPIIDNIVDNIYKSRKTLCIISRHYLESEWCSREIQVASFRLFDEQKDVLVLVFLEDIPDCQLSPYHRMRKLVKKKTYLNWPKCEEETRLFWHKLNTALETREEPDEENPILTGLETCD